MEKFLCECINAYPESLISDGIDTYKYYEFFDLCKEHANNLRCINKKSKCVIVCENEINTSLAIITCWISGLVPIPISKNYGTQHCKLIIDFIEPQLLILDFDDVNDLNIGIYNIARKAYVREYHQSTLDEELTDVSLIMCTSGSTGIPKGVMLTSNALQKNVSGISEYLNINYTDRILIARPLCHSAVLTGEFLVGLYNGSDIYFINQKYSPTAIIQYADKVKATVLCGTPTLINHIAVFLSRIGKELQIKTLSISGECLTSEKAIKIRKAFRNTKIFNVYGLTEASPRVAYLPCHLFDEHPESVGVPLRGVRIRIVNDLGEDASYNEHGHIIVNSESLMKGYYKNQELTERVLSNGWLKTGDIGYKDSSGYLYILSRVDDMIIKAGMNIYPKEIENNVLTLEQIYDCVAYGIKTNEGQSIGIDVVLNREFVNASKKDVLGWLMKVLPKYQIPDKVNIVDELKRNASGKLIRI